MFNQINKRNSHNGKITATYLGNYFKIFINLRENCK